MMSRLLGSTAVLIALLLVPVHAQGPAGSAAQGAADSVAHAASIIQVLPGAEENPPRPVTEFASGQYGGDFTAQDFIDRPLYDISGIEIGTIVDLGVDSRGTVSLVMVDVKETAGEEKRIAFAFDALAYQIGDEVVRVVANLRQSDVESAPPFTSITDAAALNDVQSAVRQDSGAASTPER